MDEQQHPSGILVTLFTLQSIYAQNDDEKLEFEYESENMNLADVCRYYELLLMNFATGCIFEYNDAHPGQWYWSQRDRCLYHKFQKLMKHRCQIL